QSAPRSGTGMQAGAVPRCRCARAPFHLPQRPGAASYTQASGGVLACTHRLAAVAGRGVLAMTSPTPKPKPANEAFPFPTREHHDAPPPDTPSPVAENPSEDALDHGVEESIPAS